MATQRIAQVTDAKALFEALTAEGLVVVPLKKYTSLLRTIRELRELIEDMEDARLVREIDQDPNHRWRPYKEVKAELISEGLLDDA